MKPASGIQRLVRLKHGVCPWVFLAALFLIILSSRADATCTQEFFFASGKLHVSFVANYGGRERGMRFLNDIRKVLPYIMGMSKAIDQEGENIDIFIGCQQYSEAFLEIDGKETKRIKCDESNFPQVISVMADELGKEVVPVYDFKGYTLQIAYVEKDKDAIKERKRWQNKLDYVEYNGTMYIEGDCTQTPIWIHRYPDNSSVIRFGIFDSYKNAKKAIGILNLGEKHSQIVPLEFNIRDLDKFFN
jgi:hypothetical protein